MKIRQVDQVTWLLKCLFTPLDWQLFKGSDNHLIIGVFLDWAQNKLSENVEWINRSVNEWMNEYLVETQNCKLYFGLVSLFLEKLYIIGKPSSSKSTCSRCAILHNCQNLTRKDFCVWQRKKCHCLLYVHLQKEHQSKDLPDYHHNSLVKSFTLVL